MPLILISSLGRLRPPFLSYLLYVVCLLLLRSLSTWYVQFWSPYNNFCIPTIQLLLLVYIRYLCVLSNLLMWSFLAETNTLTELVNRRQVIFQLFDFMQKERHVDTFFAFPTHQISHPPLSFISVIGTFFINKKS